MFDVFNASVWWRRLVVDLRTIYRGDRMVAPSLWLVVEQHFHFGYGTPVVGRIVPEK